MKDIVLYITFLVFIFLTNSVKAQDDCSDCRKWAIGIDFDLLNPIEDLNTYGFGTNSGVNMDMLHRGFKRSQIVFQPGFRLRGGSSRIDTRNEFIGLPVNQDGTRGIRNVSIDGKFVARIIYDQIWFIKPYLEADMGIRFAGANEEIETFGLTEEESLDYSEYINKGVSGTYGFGMGALIFLSDRLRLNLRTNFDLTNNIKHVDLNTIFPFDETRTSNAYNLRFAIGLNFPISCDYNEVNQK